MTEAVVQGNQSAFAQNAWQYIEHGIPCMPVAPGTKVPGECSFGVWGNRHGWQNYAHRLPTDVEVEIWETWPDGGICLPLGGVSKLLAIDIDTNRPDVIAALESELSGLLVCRKRGKRGYTAFVRVSKVDTFQLAQTKWNVDGLRVLDLLFTGRQTVMPPTIHPDTKQPYTWDTDMRPWDDEIPECPVDIVERCSRALAKFQSADDKRHELEERQRALRGSYEDDSSAEGRKINNAAMRNLNAWVPALIPAEFLHATFTGFRVKPFWRGVTDAHKCSIASDGIRDFAQEKGYTPISLVMAVRNVEYNEAADWLAPLVGVKREAIPQHDDLGPWFSDFNYKLPDEIEREQALSAVSVPVEVVVDDGVTELKPITKPSLASTQGMPPELARPPGVLGDVYRWMMESSLTPLPEVTMQAVLAFGSIMCRQIYAGPTDVRSNMMLIGIARSGFGKDHPQERLLHLLNYCGQGVCVGGSSIASGSALLSALGDPATGHAVIYVMDEVDSLLRSALGKNAQAHQADIANNMMALYSSSRRAVFKGTDYADRKMRRNDNIPYPHMTLFGCTTPDKFYDNLKGKDVASGFVNRLLVAEASDTAPPDNPGRVWSEPNGLKLWADSVRNPRHAEGMLGATPENPIRVGYADDLAKAVLANFLVEVREQRDKLYADGRGMDDALVRWHENAHKIALIAAVAKYPMGPKIDLECAQWAVDYVRYCGRVAVDAIDSRMFESDFDESVQKMLQYVIKRGEWGATKRDLSKGCRAFKKLGERGAKEVMDRLTTSGQVELRELRGKSGKVRHAWVAVDCGDE